MGLFKKIMSGVVIGGVGVSRLSACIASAGGPPAENVAIPSMIKYDSDMVERWYKSICERLLRLGETVEATRLKIDLGNMRSSLDSVRARCFSEVSGEVVDILEKVDRQLSFQEIGNIEIARTRKEMDRKNAEELDEKGAKAAAGEGEENRERIVDAKGKSKLRGFGRAPDSSVPDKMEIFEKRYSKIRLDEVVVGVEDGKKAFIDFLRHLEKESYPNYERQGKKEYRSYLQIAKIFHESAVANPPKAVILSLPNKCGDKSETELVNEWRAGREAELRRLFDEFANSKQRYSDFVAYRRKINDFITRETSEEAAVFRIIELNKVLKSSSDSEKKYNKRVDEKCLSERLETSSIGSLRGFMSQTSEIK